jgi:hypothetical protein
MIFILMVGVNVLQMSLGGDLQGHNLPLFQRTTILGGLQGLSKDGHFSAQRIVR